MTEQINNLPMTTLTGHEAIEHATKHGLTLSKYADPVDDARNGLTVEEAEEIADEDPSLIWIDSSVCRCACGKITGSPCDWTGPRDETVLVEWMPRYLRASHEAARNSGYYPANGAARLRVSAECADEVLEVEGEWAEIVAKRSEEQGQDEVSA